MKPQEQNRHIHDGNNGCGDDVTEVTAIVANSGIVEQRDKQVDDDDTE